MPAPESPIDAVVFDIGGVLLDWNPRHLYRGLFAEEAAMERFLGEICTLEWHAAHDRGVPVAESCAALAAEHPEHAALIWAWARRGEEMIAGPIGGTVQILRELRAAGVRCYALTNMEAETYPVRRDRWDFMGWFDGTIVSAHEGLIKPDPEIFALLLRRFSLVAQRTLLVDDSAANVAAASQLGIRTHRFLGADALRVELRRVGVLAA